MKTFYIILIGFVKGFSEDFVIFFLIGLVVVAFMVEFVIPRGS